MRANDPNGRRGDGQRWHTHRMCSTCGARCEDTSDCKVHYETRHPRSQYTRVAVFNTNATGWGKIRWYLFNMPSTSQPQRTHHNTSDAILKPMEPALSLRHGCAQHKTFQKQCMFTMASIISHHRIWSYLMPVTVSSQAATTLNQLQWYHLPLTPTPLNLAYSKMVGEILSAQSNSRPIV
jgi:hypothetical protein